MTLICVILYVLGAYLFLVRPRGLFYALVFFASFSATSVFNFASFGIGPGFLFFGLYIARGLLSGELLRPVAVSRDHLLVLLGLGAFAAYTIATILINGGEDPIDGLEVSQTMYLVAGLSITVFLSREMNIEGRLEDALWFMRAAAYFIVGWGIVQAACYYAGIPYPAFLFNNSTSHFADMFDQRATEGLIRIASVATEPSYMASSLMIFGAFGASVVACEPRLRTRGWMLSVLLVLGIVVASTSTSGLMIVAVLGLLIALRRPGIVMLSGLVGVGLFMVTLVLLPRFRAGVYNMTLGKTSTSSFDDRFGSVFVGLRSFVEHPWIGHGWGTDFSYSIVTMMLANVGVIGTILFLVVFVGTLFSSYSARHLVPDPRQWRLRAYAIGAENAMIVYMFGSAISGFRYPLPDFWILWALTLSIPSILIRSRASMGRNQWPVALNPAATDLQMALYSRTRVLPPATEA